MSKRRADHVVLNFKTNAFECRHCGDAYAMAMPVSIDMMCSMSASFLKSHRQCKPSTPPAPKKDADL